MAPRKPLFVVLEGPDKCGKSTQAGLLVRALRRRGLKVVHTREPGGTAFAEAVRRVILDPAYRVHPVAELLLYEAARAQHVQETLLPALRSGKVVVCERFTLATLVYQGSARGLARDVIGRLNRIATGGLTPDLTLVFDVPDREFRRRDPSRRPDRLERESAAFRLKVAAGYRRFARRLPRTVLLDGDRPVEDVRKQVLSLVERRLA